MAQEIVGSVIFSNDEQLAAAGQMLSSLRDKLLQGVIAQRIFDRKKLAGKLTTAEMNLDGSNRQQIASLSHSIEQLQAIHTDLLAETEKGK